MANGWTNRGKKLVLDYGFEGTSPPTNYYVALITSAVAPDAETDTLGTLTQISGGGYAAAAVAAGTAFTTSEDDTADRGKTVMDDVAWTADGADLGAARYAVLCDGNVSGSNVIAYFDLSSDRTVSDGQTLTLTACELQLNEPS